MHDHMGGHIGGRLGGRWLHAMRPYDGQLELSLSAAVTLRPLKRQKQRNKGKTEFTADVGACTLVVYTSEPTNPELSLSLLLSVLPKA